MERSVEVGEQRTGDWVVMWEGIQAPHQGNQVALQSFAVVFEATKEVWMGVLMFPRGLSGLERVELAAERSKGVAGAQRKAGLEGLSRVPCPYYHQ